MSSILDQMHLNKYRALKKKEYHKKDAERSQINILWDSFLTDLRTII